MKETIFNIVSKYIDDPNTIEMIIDELEDELKSKYVVSKKTNNYYWEHLDKSEDN